MMQPFTRLCVLVLALAAAAPAVAQPATEPPPVETPDTIAPPSTPDDGFGRSEGFDRNYWGRPVFRIGRDYTLEPQEEIRDAVVISGNASIAGRVNRDVVVVFGTARIAATAVIEGSLVIVGGSAVVTEGARVEGDFVVVGGSVDAPPSFSPDGQHIVIGHEMLGGRIEAVVPWITRGLLWGRPIVPDLGWVWGIVALFFLVYLTINLVFDRPVRSCADFLTTKPLTALLAGLMVLLLSGPVLLLLTVSVVGIAVVPFLVCALLLALIVGKVGVARWIGMSVLPEGDRTATLQSRAQALRSFTIGFAVLCVAYMIPVLGFIAWASVGVLGLGAAVTAFLAGYRRENPASPRPVRAAVAAPAPPVAYQPGPSYPPTPPPLSFQEASMPDPAQVMQTPATPTMSSTVQPVTSELLAYPHAPFRDRLAAFLLDVVLVVIAAGLLDIADSGGPRLVFLLLLAYHIGFWHLKGTTVGGIICQLRVVRINGEPLRFVDALVRGLSAIFSLAVLGLGCLWIIKDPERQAWHDYIAGTYVVKVPRHYPL